MPGNNVMKRLYEIKKSDFNKSINEIEIKAETRTEVVNKFTLELEKGVANLEKMIAQNAPSKKIEKQKEINNNLMATIARQTAIEQK